MSMLSDLSSCGESDEFEQDAVPHASFGGSPTVEPTLDDLLNRVGGDFTYNYFRQQEIEDKIRAAQALPGNSVSTPVYGLRGAIGQGLRAIADRYFTQKPLSQDNIPGYRRIGS